MPADNIKSKPPEEKKSHDSERQNERRDQDAVVQGFWLLVSW
jgi:hypothetical protein